MPQGYSATLEGTYQAYEEAAARIGVLALASLLPDIPGAAEPLSLGGIGPDHHGQHSAGADRQRRGVVDRRAAALGRQHDGLRHPCRHQHPQRHPQGQPLHQPRGSTRARHSGPSSCMRGSLDRLAPVLLTALSAGLALTPLLFASRRARPRDPASGRGDHLRRARQLDAVRCGSHADACSSPLAARALERLSAARADAARASRNLLNGGRSMCTRLSIALACVGDGVRRRGAERRQRRQRRRGRRDGRSSDRIRRPRPGHHLLHSGRRRQESDADQGIQRPCRDPGRRQDHRGRARPGGAQHVRRPARDAARLRRPAWCSRRRSRATRSRHDSRQSRGNGIENERLSSRRCGAAGRDGPGSSCSCRHLRRTRAFAHSEQGVAIDFWGGFTHPIFGLDHVVAMVAVRSLGGIPRTARHLAVAGGVSPGDGGCGRLWACSACRFTAWRSGSRSPPSCWAPWSPAP